MPWLCPRYRKPSDKIFKARRMPVCVTNLFLVSAILFAFTPLMDSVKNKASTEKPDAAVERIQAEAASATETAAAVDAAEPAGEEKKDHRLAIMMCLLLAGIGFFLFGPDAMIASPCAVDFGTKKGAGSAAGLINGLGSIGQTLGLAVPGFILYAYGKDAGWPILWKIYAGGILLAALILLPKWNAVPGDQKSG